MSDASKLTPAEEACYLMLSDEERVMFMAMSPVVRKAMVAKAAEEEANVGKPLHTVLRSERGDTLVMEVPSDWIKRVGAIKSVAGGVDSFDGLLLTMLTDETKVRLLLDGKSIP